MVLVIFKCILENPLHFSPSSRVCAASAHWELCRQSWWHWKMLPGGEGKWAPLTSTSPLALPGQQWGVRGRSPSAAISSFSLGACQPLVLDQNAFSFTLWDSDPSMHTSEQGGGTYKPITHSWRASTGAFRPRKAQMHKMKDMLLMICFYLFSKTSVKEFKVWIHSQPCTEVDRVRSVLCLAGFPYPAIQHGICNHLTEGSVCLVV